MSHSCPISKHQKTLEKVLQGRSDRNIPFRDMRRLLKYLGFSERIKGDHHIYSIDDVVEIINLQPNGVSVKAYQVKQVREIILEYQLGGHDDD